MKRKSKKRDIKKTLRKKTCRKKTCRKKTYRKKTCRKKTKKMRGGEKTPGKIFSEKMEIIQTFLADYKKTKGEDAKTLCFYLEDY